MQRRLEGEFCFSSTHFLPCMYLACELNRHAAAPLTLLIHLSSHRHPAVQSQVSQPRTNYHIHTHFEVKLKGHTNQVRMPLMPWEETLTCPYNPAHQITPARMQTHLVSASL